MENETVDEKGLASRVEELEKLLRRCYQWIPLELSGLADDVKEALGMETYRALAQPSGNTPGKDAK